MEGEDEDTVDKMARELSEIVTSQGVCADRCLYEALHRLPIFVSIVSLFLKLAEFPDLAVLF